MQLKIVMPAGKFYAFHLEDEDGNKVGELFADTYEADHLPTTVAMTRFQGATIVLDGKSLKRLGREIREQKESEG